MTHYFARTQAQLIEKNAIHTAKEINHQPQLWQHVLSMIVESKLPITNFLSPILNNPNSQIILTGAGSSAFAGKALAPWLKANTRRDVLAIATTDIVANPRFYLTPDKPTLLISFGRSGNSPESVAAVQLADQVCENIHHLMLVCNPNGALAIYAKDRKNALALIMPEGSNDQSFAMTSSFSCMMLTAGLLMSNTLLNQNGFDEAEVSKIQNKLSQLNHSVSQIAEKWLTDIQTLAQSNFKRYVVIGSCGFTGLAEEAALKLLELTAGQVATRFDSALGLRHGPKFMVDNETLVLQFISNDAYTQQYDLDLMEELKRNDIAAQHIILTASEAAQFAVNKKLNDLKTSKGTSVSPKYTYQVIESDNDFWSLFVYIYFAQLFAMETSLALGNTPDNPCPTGEVNRVVQGVKIHPYPNYL